MSATLGPAEPGLRYVLRRLAVYLGARERALATLIAHGARADGWLAVEALQALSGSHLAAGRVAALRLRDGRDLELELDGEPAGVRLLSLPGFDPQKPEELARELQALETGVLITVAYPLRADDAAWLDGIPDLERVSGTRMEEQLQVQLAGPDRVTVSLWQRRPP